MNADRLLEHFDRLCEAPDAIPRLRRFIVDLAVRGTLSEQRPTDGNARDIILGISADKTGLSIRNRLRDAVDISKTESTVEPHSIPDNWTWASLSDLTTKIHYGFTASANAAITKVRLLRITDIQDNRVDWLSVPGCDIDDGVVDQYRLVRGDILIARTGGTIGKTFLVDDPPLSAVFASYLIRVQPSNRLDCRFVKLFMESSAYWRQLEEGARGGGQPNVNGQTLGRMLVAVPPSAEQHRIVARVDELMALCDRLEAAQTERERRRDRLAAASLARLNRPSDDREEFHRHVRFHIGNLSQLATRPRQIASIRQAILNLAFRGALLTGDSRSSTTQPLRECVELQNGYAFKSEWFTKSGVRLLRNTNVSHGVARWDELACLPEDRVAEFDRFRLAVGDVVLSLDRPFIATGTKVARVREIDLPCLLLQRVGRFQLDLSKIVADYLYLWILSPQFTDQIDPGRSNGVPHISSRQVEAAEIYLPTLDEQRRIVAKVEELMSLCDTLESRLSTAESQCHRFLEALLNESLNAASGERSDAFAGTRSEPKTLSADDGPVEVSNKPKGVIFTRGAIAAYVIDRLHAREDFGTVQLEKTMYLTEAWVGFDMAGDYRRMIAGPLDPALYPLQNFAAKQKWFFVAGGKGRKARYTPGPRIADRCAAARTLLGDKLADMVRLVDAIEKMNTEQAEVFATVFAAWNDFLLAGESPTDNQIVIEVRENWHEAKQRFTAERLQECITWMRRSEIVPRGIGPKTRLQKA